MEVLKTFRHEFKYVISYDESLRLRDKLDQVLRYDRSSRGYMVRSLYFDSVDDEDYYDKQGGEIKRKKIRLRIYDTTSDYVKLELKGKYDIHQLKESLVINRAVAKELIKGNYGVLLNYDSDTAKKIYVIMAMGGYRPKVIIEYERIAYITATTTRITMDYNIKRSYDFDNFFNDQINYVTVVDNRDMVLEVKYDRFLEPYLGNIMSNYITRYQSVSKYVMGRNI